MKIIDGCRNRTALFAFLLIVNILLCSELAAHHHSRPNPDNARRSYWKGSRKLAMASMSNFSSRRLVRGAGSAPDKSMETTSMRKVPASGPNPTQNK
ncbi:hypothetical protein CRG98_025422 [Punica granatum]|nr:hypothetical protein CRG98_025422 [Punica granatum]